MKTDDRNQFVVRIDIPEQMRHLTSLDETPHWDMLREAVRYGIREAGWSDYTEHHERTEDALTVTVKRAEVAA